MTKKPPVSEIGTTRLKPGWNEGLAMNTYLADPAVSASMLWKVHSETPADLKEEWESKERPTSDPKEIGNVLHTAVYEPDELDGRYVVLGTCAGEFNDGRACTYQGSYYRDGQSFCKNHDPARGEPAPPGIYTVSQSVKDTAVAMKKSLLAHPTAAELVRIPGPREVTITWQDEATGLWCRIRPDHLSYEDPTVRQAYHFAEINLKSTGRSAAEEPFTRQAEKDGHYFKAAFYRMGLWASRFDVRHHYRPVVEQFPPYKVIVYRVDEDALDEGESEVRRALGLIAECRASGEWPAYGPAIRHLSLTPYRLRQLARLRELV